MAREVVEKFTDDLDPTTEATHVGVSFAFEGVEYTIDLNDENYEGLKYSIEKYADHATRVSGGRGRGRSAGSASTSSSREKKEELQAVRVWAEKNGIELNARGRIKETVLNAYRENDPSLAS